MPGYSHPGQHTTDGYIAELLRRLQTTVGGVLSVSEAGIEAHHDKFTVAGTPATTYTLTYIPLDQAVWVALNGLTMDEGTDYTCDYSTGIITVNTTNQPLTTGDVLLARYLTTTDLVAASAPAGTGITPTIWLKLDETSGTVAADSSGNGNTYVYNGGYTLGQPSLLHSAAGTSVLLNGTTGTIGPATSIQPSNGTTVTAAVRFKLTDAGINALWDRDVFGSAPNRQWQFRVSAGKVQVILFDGSGNVLVSLTGATTVNNGAAHHAAFTVDGSTLRIYVDGTLDASAAGSLHGSGASLALGVSRSASGGTNTQFFHGTLDDAKYWDGVVLTAAQISSEAAQ